MGVYIKTMEMPTGCGALTLTVWPDGQVEIIDADGEWKTSEAVPVPPHGDLIDRDKLEKDIDKYIGGEESRSRFHHWVQVQRTVIPESKETHT